VSLKYQMSGAAATKAPPFQQQTFVGQASWSAKIVLRSIRLFLLSSISSRI